MTYFVYPVPGWVDWYETPWYEQQEIRTDGTTPKTEFRKDTKMNEQQIQADNYNPNNPWGISGISTASLQIPPPKDHAFEKALQQLQYLQQIAMGLESASLTDSYRDDRIAEQASEVVLTALTGISNILKAHFPVEKAVEYEPETTVALKAEETPTINPAFEAAIQNVSLDPYGVTEWEPVTPDTTLIKEISDLLDKHAEQSRYGYGLQFYIPHNQILSK